MGLKALYVELYYGQYSKLEVREQITKYIAINGNIPVNTLIELLEINENYESQLFSLIHTTDSNFFHNCLEAEILAAKFFLKILSAYQDGNVTPFRLCTIFSSLEAGFIGAPRNLAKSITYYPEWIGALYDACDWCDEAWTIENTPHLGEAVQHQIRIINEWLADFI